MPVLAIEYYGIFDKLIVTPSDQIVVMDSNGWSMVKIVNYLILYGLLVFLQFSALRRLSKRELFGLALRNQVQQRKLIVKSILWILSVVFTIV